MIIERVENSSLSLDKSSIEMIKISDEEYFGDKYKDYISNSSMKYINPSQGGDPYSYKYGDKSFSAGFLDLGSILHMKILENKTPNIYIGDVPTGKMFDMLNESAKIELESGKKVVESKNDVAIKFDYYKGNGDLYLKNAFKFRYYYSYLISKKEDDFFVNQKAKEVLDKAESIIPIIQSFIQGEESFVETTILANFVYNNNWRNNCNTTTLKTKAKIDNFIVNHSKKEIILNDLKTTFRSVDDFMDSFEKYHYSRQFSFYLYLLKNKLNLEDYTLKANTLVISTTDCGFKIYPINQNQIIEGYNEWSDCLKRIGFHETYGYNVLIDKL